MSLVKREVEQAITGIFGGFIWSKTKKGAKYWGRVLENLILVLEEEQG